MNHESIKDIVSRALPDESQKQSESVQVFNKSFNEINIVLKKHPALYSEVLYASSRNNVGISNIRKTIFDITK